MVGFQSKPGNLVAVGLIRGPACILRPGVSEYVDQAAVQAAMHGRVLVLEDPWVGGRVDRGWWDGVWTVSPPPDPAARVFLAKVVK